MQENIVHAFEVDLRERAEVPYGRRNPLRGKVEDCGPVEDDVDVPPWIALFVLLRNKMMKLKWLAMSADRQNDRPISAQPR